MTGRGHTVLDSPIGPMTVVCEADTLIGVYMEDQRHLPDPVKFGEPSTGPLFDTVQRQLAEYFGGQRTEFDLPLAPRGTEFQRQVWDELRQIPFGETSTYGEIAERVGRPTAFRAVGAANGRNPISIIIPCHRLVSSTGGLISYGGGLERKRHLLGLEERVRGR